jgi:hypothetical protein
MKRLAKRRNQLRSGSESAEILAATVQIALDQGVRALAASHGTGEVDEDEDGDGSDMFSEIGEDDWSGSWLEDGDSAASELALTYFDGADGYLRALHGSGSRATDFRRQKERRELMAVAQRPGQSTLDAFLRLRPAGCPPLSQPPVQYLSGFEVSRLEETLEVLKGITSSRSNAVAGYSTFEVLRLAAVQLYLRGILDGRRKMEASRTAAQVLGPGKEGPNRCTMVRAWGKRFFDDGQLPPPVQGMHQKTVSMIDDEDVRSRSFEYLRSQPFGKVSPQNFRGYLNEELLPEITGSPSSVSIRTAQNWLHSLNFRFGEAKKGIYIDGHEREDVVKYRVEFLGRMEKWLPLMATFDEDSTGHMVMTLPNLSTEQKRHVLVVHDESIFTSYDAGRFFWTEKDGHVLRKKGQGKSIMVSDFLCECHGPMHRNLADGSKDLVRTTITPGSGVSDDGWWTNEDLVRQFEKKVLPSFEESHLGCVGVFAFDNSMNHKKMPHDALDVTRLNLSDGGKNARLVIRDGWFTQGGQTIVQPMLASGRIQKGIWTILQERGLWEEKMKLSDARQLLSVQADFANQKCLLQEIVEGRLDESGQQLHQFILFPKFHCEFNHIELYWAQGKRYARANCDYSFPGLKRVVPEALDSVSLDIIRRNARFCFRYMDAYRMGLPPALADFAAKKYKSHRSMPGDMVRETLEREYREKSLQ